MRLNKNVHITFIDGDDGLIDKIEEFFLNKENLGIKVVGKFNTRSGFLEKKEISLDTDIFVISASLPDGTGIELVEFIKKSSKLKDKPVFLMIDKQTMNYASIAPEKGVDEVIQKPFKVGEFIQTVYKHTKVSNGETNEKSGDAILDRLKNRNEKTNNKEVRERKENTTNNKKELSIEDLEMLENDENNKMVKKGVYSFVSSSSSGKTSIIVNLAYALRKIHGKKPSVCILDLNLLFPSAVYMFHQDELIMPKRDIYDVTKELNFMNEELLMESIIKHEPTGIHIINTPTSSESLGKISSIDGSHVEKLIVLLREMFDIILIDTPNKPNEDVVLIPMQYSDKIFIVMEPNFIEVAETNKILFIVEKLEESIRENVKEKTYLILNKENKRNSIDNETTKYFLEGKKFIVRIPEDPNFLTIINKGEFVLNTDSPTSKSINELTKFVYNFDGEFEKKENAFSKFLTKIKKNK